MNDQSYNMEKIHKSVKEYRFDDALLLIRKNLTKDSGHKDSLYLAAVCYRYLKQFNLSKDFLKKLLTVAPDMGRAYQELGHLHRDSGNEQQAIAYYRQATDHNPALLASWKILYNYYDKTQNKASAKYSLDKIKDLEALPKILLHINQILHEGNIKLKNGYGIAS